MGTQYQIFYQLYEPDDTGRLQLIEGHFATTNPETNEYDQIFEFHLNDNHYNVKSLTTDFSVDLSLLDVDADGFEKGLFIIYFLISQ